jgi:hypothetical protein
MSDELEELKKQDLLIAKNTVKALCTTEYNLFLSTRTGEEIQPFIKLWKERLAATNKEIKAAQTVESVFEIENKFDSDLLDYIKATKVNTADKAMEIAHSFIKKYSPVALPLKAAKEGNVWVVDIDVGALAVKIAKVKIDARTGDILSYDIPQKENKEG